MKKENNNSLKINLDLKDYPLEAIYSASYVFLDKAYVFLQSKASQKIEISLKGKRKLSPKQLDKLKGEFLNELLHYVVRVNLAKRNRKIREFIVGQALIGAVGENVVAKEGDVEYEDDPLGIAVPWEEKYGAAEKIKKKKSVKIRQTPKKKK